MPPAKKPSFQERLDAQTTDLEHGKTYVVGVAIFRASPDPASFTKHQLLVVKRAAHEESFPNKWEIPGGRVEPGETVRQCVERETLEETGLRVERVVGELAELRWDSASSGKKSVQMNYAVTVQEPVEIRLDPDEHSEWLWANEDQVDGLDSTPAMKEVLRGSFEYSKTNSVL
ncbi:NUDIX hydrolase domain-like protein [Usnea florida]